MASQNVFKRYELKYIITREQKDKILDEIKTYIRGDEYGNTVIRNIYFDTENYRLIRKSIEKPEYKEKLRLRSYQKSSSDSEVFVELKKKYKHVVYKRRVCLPEREALDWLCNKGKCSINTQIAREINYFLEYYKELKPTVFLSYEREAYYSNDVLDFRLTFDKNILCRQDDISLAGEIYGTPILSDDMVLMEIKCSGGIPLWMTRVLTKEHIYKTSFSKYGTAYQKIIFPKLKEVYKYA